MKEKHTDYNLNSATQLLNKIRTESIEPIPKWRIQSSNVTIRTIFLVTLILGASAFAVVLYAIQQSDFNLIEHFGHSNIERILSILPIIWLLLLLLFLVLAIAAIQRTNKAYKIGLLHWLWINLFSSIVLGTLFFLLGGGRFIDHAFAAQFETYHGIEERKAILWSQPDRGYLSGTINTISEEYFSITDLKDQDWTIFLEDTWIAPVLLMEPGEKVKIIGSINGNNTFQADEVRPWGGQNQRMRNTNK